MNNSAPTLIYNLSPYHDKATSPAECAIIACRHAFNPNPKQVWVHVLCHGEQLAFEEFKREFTALYPDKETSLTFTSDLEINQSKLSTAFVMIGLTAVALFAFDRIASLYLY